MLASDAVPRKPHGHAAEAAALRVEALMGQAIPRQDPAVVLRSHFNHLRALLAIALVAVAGLTVALVILAKDSDEVGTTGAAVQVESAGSSRFQAESVDRTSHQPGVRHDGDPGSFGRPGSQNEFRGSKTSEDGTPRFARPGSESDPHGPASALP
jgi:hypothetical protein